jgi:multicomponent K+:H+ antiporter subunit E
MKGLPARWVPHPWLSALLLVAWLWLNNTVHPGHLVLGAMLALAIPAFTRRFWPDPIPVHRPVALLQYLLLVLYDVVVANLQVAVLILGPASRWRPAFVRVPLELRTDFAVSVLASTVTLTPGTVSVDVEEAPDGRRVLVVHALRCTDERELVESIRQRYERRLREILEC